MRTKLIFPIACVLLLLATIGSALALENVSQFGITDEHQWWLQGSKSASPYTYNWTDIGQDDNLPLVYDLNGDGKNEIINSRSGTIKVYNATGSVIASQYFAGLDSRQVSAFDAQSCPSGKGLYAVLADATMSVICLEGSSLVVEWTCATPYGSATTPDFTGASVSKEGGDNLAVYYFLDVTTHMVAFCDESSLSDAEYSLGNNYTQTWKGTPPHGNLKNDGYEYWVFPYISSTQVGVTYINKLGSATTITPITTSETQDPIERQPIVVKRGSGQADELLITYVSSLYPYSEDAMWYGDATGYTYFNFASGIVYNRFTPPVQLGTNGDICYSTYATGYGGSFYCFTPSNVSYSYSQPLGVGSYKFLTATDMNNDGWSDFFLDNGLGTQLYLCYYDSHNTSLNCSVVGTSGLADYAYGVDIDGDGHRDIIVSDETNNLLRVYLTNGAILPPTLTCDDTDANGTYPSWNPLVYGEISGSNFTNANDTCYNSTILIEHFCSTNTSGIDRSAYEDCYADYGSGSCVNGTCVAGNLSSCSDTDFNGTYPSLNYFVAGTKYGTNLTTQMDYCDPSTNLLFEYECYDNTTGTDFAYSFNCSSINMTCDSGACVPPSPPTTCIDSDINTTNPYLVKGNVSTMVLNTTQYFANDSCLNITHVRERSCYNSTTPTLNYYDCSNLGGTCVDGKCDPTTGLDCSAQGGVLIGGVCVISQNCSSYTDTYSYPTLWLDTFGYHDVVTNHGWVGYPFMVGDNLYGVCNILFMDMNKSTAQLSYQFDSDIIADATFRWDMYLESSVNQTSYVPNAMPTEIRFKSIVGTTGIGLDFAPDGQIYSLADNGSIGNWQDFQSSYKVIIHPDNSTFEFYYTNSTNYLSYVEGCSNCSFMNNVSIRKFVVAPQPPFPYGYSGSLREFLIAPIPINRLNYSSVGIWLDNIQLASGVELPPSENQTNFCYFTGCIFHDHFDYTNDTYQHGWYMFNTTPYESVANYTNDTEGFYFDHQINTIHKSDSGGIFSIQFKVLFPQPSPSVDDRVEFLIYTPELTSPFSLQFTSGSIFDNNGIDVKNFFGLIEWGKSIGTFSYNTWTTYTLLINMNAGTYDLYANSNKLTSNNPIPLPMSSISKVGFWINDGSAVKIDYITLARGNQLVGSAGNGINPDTGVPNADLRWCWSDTNGSFNWACCTPQENITRSIWCPIRVTFRYWLGGVATFVLNNFIYFIIIIIIFVILVPFIVPRPRDRSGG